MVQFVVEPILRSSCSNDELVIVNFGLEPVIDPFSSSHKAEDFLLFRKDESLHSNKESLKNLSYTFKQRKTDQREGRIGGAVGSLHYTANKGKAAWVGW